MIISYENAMNNIENGAKLKQCRFLPEARINRKMWKVHQCVHTNKANTYGRWSELVVRNDAVRINSRL
jgi:hypothetical protein